MNELNTSNANATGRASTRESHRSTIALTSTIRGSPGLRATIAFGCATALTTSEQRTLRIRPRLIADDRPATVEADLSRDRLEIQAATVDEIPVQTLRHEVALPEMPVVARPHLVQPCEARH